MDLSRRANSVFWTRALNIPLPRTFVFPEGQQGSSDHLSNLSYDSKTSCNPSSFQEVAKKADKSDTGLHLLDSDTDL